MSIAVPYMCRVRGASNRLALAVPWNMFPACRCISTFNALSSAKPSSSMPLSYSSLHVNGKYATQMTSIVKPHLDFEKLLNDVNMTRLKDSVAKRNILKDNSVPSPQQLDDLAAQIANLIKLSGECDQVTSILKAKQLEFDSLRQQGTPSDSLLGSIKEISANAKSLKSRVWNLEEMLVPKFLDLPNYVGEDVPAPGDLVVLKEKARLKRPPYKMLDHVKLTYINESVFSSIVGPESAYSLGRTAQLHIALANYFTKVYTPLKFIELVGSDLVKSALIEAINSKGRRHYGEDPLRICRGYDSLPFSQQIHLAGEASLEALCGALAKLANPSISRSRLIATGSNYTSERDRLRQAQEVRTVSLLRTTDNGLVKDEVSLLNKMLWDAYDKLGIPCRLVKRDMTQLLPSELSADAIEVWLPSQGNWLESARVSNYSNYIPNRLGLKDMQLIGSSAISCRLASASIIEHFQTETGTFTIPECLQDFML